MSTPLYSIPGATAPPAAAPADRAAVAVQNANDARTVNDVLAQSQVGAVEGLSRIAEPDIRASRVFQLAAAQKPA